MADYYYVIKLPNGNYWSSRNMDRAGVPRIRQADIFWAISRNVLSEHEIPKGSIWVKVEVVTQDEGTVW